MFLTRWVGMLVGSSTRELSVTELRDIAGAVDGLADLPTEQRTIGAVRTFLNNTDPEGIAARLRRWERGGPLGWVFGNVIKDIGFGDFGGSGKFIGYDMTDFLDNEEIRTPLGRNSPCWKSRSAGRSERRRAWRTMSGTPCPILRPRPHSVFPSHPRA